jgi:hypothetical protein
MRYSIPGGVFFLLGIGDEALFAVGAWHMTPPAFQPNVATTATCW